MKDEEIVRMITNEIREIPNTSIYYTLKRMKLANISQQQMFAIKIFLALQKHGVHIVDTNIFIIFYKRTRSAALQMLHELGDKGVLVYVKNNKPGPLRYILSNQFNKTYTQTSEPKDLNTRTG